MRTLLAGGLLMVASVLLVLGVVAVFTVDDVRSMLAAGLVLIGGGVLLVRLSGRVYLSLPSAFRAPEDATEQEARDHARDLARRQGRATAVFLAALTVLYLVVGLFLVGGEAGVGAAAITALCSGLLGGLAWWQGRDLVDD